MTFIVSYECHKLYELYKIQHCGHPVMRAILHYYFWGWPLSTAIQIDNTGVEFDACSLHSHNNFNFSKGVE